MYLGKRSASLMKEFLQFLQFGDDIVRNGCCGNYPIFEYWSYRLFKDLQIVCGLGAHFWITNILMRSYFC